jgi:hypothetical protein
VKTGNLRLGEMKLLFDKHVDSILKALQDSSLIELYEEELLIIA